METFYSIDFMEKTKDSTQINQGLRIGLILNNDMSI